MRLVEIEQRLLPRRQGGKIARLLDPLHGRAGRRPAIRQLVLGVERLVAHRIPAGIGAEIDLVARGELAPQRLHPDAVTRLGRADEVVVGDLHAPGEIAKPLRHLVGERLRRLAGGGCGLLHLLAVLVGAGEETDAPALQAREAGDRVARQRGVRVTDVRRVVDVVDRRRDVERVSRGHGWLRVRRRRGPVGVIGVRRQQRQHLHEGLAAFQVQCLDRSRQARDLLPQRRPAIKGTPRRQLGEPLVSSGNSGSRVGPARCDHARQQLLEQRQGCPRSRCDPRRAPARSTARPGPGDRSALWPAPRQAAGRSRAGRPRRSRARVRCCRAPAA